MTLSKEFMLKTAQFGDKFRTRDGSIAILIKRHDLARRKVYECMVGKCYEPNMADAVMHPYNEDGRAQEGFTHFDLVEEIK